MVNQQNLEKSEYFDYFAKIEETFIRLRGRNLLISPSDWALIEQWEARKIPLKTVCAAIEKCFARKDDGRIINSFSYCRHQVEEDFRKSITD
jgi:hypothetical protein